MTMLKRQLRKSENCRIGMMTYRKCAMVFSRKIPNLKVKWLINSYNMKNSRKNIKKNAMNLL